MGRAWTLQEGALARSCLLQLDDCILNTSYMNHRSPYSISNVKAKTGSCSWVVVSKWWRQLTHQRHFYEAIESKTPKTLHVPLLFIDGFLRYLFAILLTLVALGGFSIWLFIRRFNISIGYTSEPDLEYPGPQSVARPTNVNDLVTSELRRRLWESIRSPVALVGSDLMIPFQTVQKHGLDFATNSCVPRFCAVWNAMVGRSTTKPQDLHLILANLLGFNAGSMIRSTTKPAERMAASKYAFT
jgi:hypothetical protein